MSGTGKRVQNPRCRATVSESLAQGHCANGKAPPLSATQVATRKPGDRRELRGPRRTPTLRAMGCPVNQPLSRAKEECMFIVRVMLAALLWCTAALAADLKVSVQSPSGERVSGVQVSLFRSSDNSGVGVQTTAGDGTATFPNLADGQYRAVVLAPGFAEESLQVAIPSTEALTVQLELTTTPQTVVVSATATPTTAEQTGTSVGVLTSEQLSAINPIAAPDALLYIPGAIISTAGRRGNISSLFVRGGESNYNKVLVDGVPVNDPGGYFDFGVVPMNNIDRLEVERGPESTVYGSDAMTSVVQLWTATGSTRTPGVQFGADGGNFSTAHGYASLAGARGVFDYNVFANQFDTQGQGV